MSRQSKKANKKAARDAVVYEHNEKGVRTGRKSGPKQTTPKHGKVNRWPYDKSAPQRKPRSDT